MLIPNKAVKYDSNCISTENTGIHCFVESQTNKEEDNSDVQSQVSLSIMPMVPEQVLREFLALFMLCAN